MVHRLPRTLPIYTKLLEQPLRNIEYYEDMTRLMSIYVFIPIHKRKEWMILYTEGNMEYYILEKDEHEVFSPIFYYSKKNME